MDGSTGVEDIALGILGFVVATAIFGSFIWSIVTKIRHRVEDVPTAMKTYAQERGLTFEDGSQFPPATPLLRYRSKALGMVSGELAPGLEGKLAHYRYDRNDNDTDNEQAVLLTPLPEAAGACMYLDRGTSSGNQLEDALTVFKTAQVESAAFRSRYQLRVRDEANMIAIRQLFSPSFIVFLTEEVPPGFWFEVEDGYVMGAIKGENWDRPDLLDAVCAATAEVARRIRKDVAERMELRGATSPQPPAPPPPPNEPPPPPS